MFEGVNALVSVTVPMHPDYKTFKEGQRTKAGECMLLLALLLVLLLVLLFVVV